MNKEQYEKVLTRLEITRIRITDVIKLAIDILMAFDEKHCDTFIKMLSEMITDKYNQRCNNEY